MDCESRMESEGSMGHERSMDRESSMECEGSMVDESTTGDESAVEDEPRVKMETSDAVMYFANDMKTALAILKCFDWRISQTTQNFDFRGSFYSIRYHILGFKEILDWGRAQGEELLKEVEESAHLRGNKTLMDNVNKTDKLHSEIGSKTDGLITYMTKRSRENFLGEPEMVNWEDEIVFPPGMTWRKVFLTQTDFLRKDIKLTRDILECLDKQIERRPSFQALYKKFILHACNGSIGAFDRCGEKLKELYLRKKKKLSEIRAVEIGEEVECFQAEIRELGEKHKAIWERIAWAIYALQNPHAT